MIVELDDRHAHLEKSTEKFASLNPKNGMQSMYDSRSICFNSSNADLTFYKLERTNYPEFSQKRFLSPPISVPVSYNNFEIDCEKGAFCSLFQPLYLSQTLELNICYNEHCPSLRAKDVNVRRLLNVIHVQSVIYIIQLSPP